MINNLSSHFIIDRSKSIPIFEQLCKAVRKLAHSGDLKKGAALPATRVLAENLSISRSTVVTAYEQLVAEGYLESKVGAGYTLCSIGAVEPPHIETEIPQMTESVPALVPLIPSQPDMRLFPYRQWAKSVARVCRTNPESMLTGADVFGNLSFRKSIANHVNEWRELKASPQQIIVTTGATEALNICLKLLVKTGQTVGIEDPGYKPISRFVESQSLIPTYLDIDKNGAVLPEAHINPSMVILTPSHQYPLGGAMSAQRRFEYIHWANTQKAWIIEDDYDSEFRYAGRPIQAMAGLDGLNRTIYIGSFSKVFSNTLRLGYMIAPSSLVNAIRNVMNDNGLKAGLMPQQPLSEFLDSGDFYRHLRRTRKTYNQRRKFLVNELSTKFSHFGWVQNHPAGMQLVFHLNKPLIDTEVAARATVEGIALEPLSESTVRSLDYNGFILGFCGYTEDEISLSLKKLMILLSELAYGHS